jgi:hypothetical protein
MTCSVQSIRASVIAATLGLVTTPAAADLTKSQCATANANGQDLRRDGNLAEAREQLRSCASSSCPAVVHTDCTKRLDELEAAQPTIVFDAKDGSGADITVVKVGVDDQLLAEKLDGSALYVDPGEHTFTFEVVGQPPVTQHLVLKEGEKGRHEKIVVGSPPPLPAAKTGPPIPPPEQGMGTQKVLGLVAGGVGVAGVAAGGVLGLLTASAISRQKTDCASATSCANRAQGVSDHSTWTTDGTLSTVAFVAGGVLLAGGAVLFFTARPSTERSPATTGLMVVPSAGPGGAGVLLKGRF